LLYHQKNQERAAALHAQRGTKMRPGYLVKFPFAVQKRLKPTGGFKNFGKGYGYLDVDHGGKINLHLDYTAGHPVMRFVVSKWYLLEALKLHLMFKPIRKAENHEYLWYDKKIFENLTIPPENLALSAISDYYQLAADKLETLLECEISDRQRSYANSMLRTLVLREKAIDLIDLPLAALNLCDIQEYPTNTKRRF